VSWHVALIVGACVLAVKLTIWAVRLAFKLLVGAVRYSVIIANLLVAGIAALPNGIVGH
jgi:hypothetical protein